MERHLHQARELIKAGRTKKAEAIFDSLLKASPTHAQLNFEMGVLKYRQQQKAAALAYLTQARDAAPENVQYWLALADVQGEHGMFEAALDTIRNAVMLHQAGSSGQALRLRAETIKRHLSEVHYNKGVRFVGEGNMQEAESAYRNALTHVPDFVEALTNLGTLLRMRGDHSEAEQLYLRALAIDPTSALIYDNLAQSQRVMGKSDAALNNYRKAIALEPGYIPAYNNLGYLLQDLGNVEEAESCFQAALEYAPDAAAVYNNLGLLLKKAGRYPEAKSAFERAIEAQPDFVSARNNLGGLLMDMGALADAERAFRRSLAINPQGTDAYSCLLLLLNYMAYQTEPGAAFDEARAYGQLVSALAEGAVAPHLGQREADPENLRVGFVSGDLRNHPVGYFLETILAHLHQYPLDLVAYSTSASEDELTTRIKPFFSAWHQIADLSDKAAAALIRQHDVDILVDLAGHTGGTRLPVFAYKPAPLQVSWLGYFATTGVAEIDYILADSVTLIDSEERYFTEKVWRMPKTRFCFSPPHLDIAPGPLPALGREGITFGCFNSLLKLNDPVVETWAEILVALPASRLVLKARQLEDACVREALKQRFIRAGAKEEQLAFEGPSSRADYFSSYHRIDIALDPFPFPGGTTTMEAIWMGVPVLAMTGESFICRQGHGMLENMGLGEWVAETRSEYVEKALIFSKRLEHLAELRSTLRTSALASPMFDAAMFAAELNEAFRGMWRQSALRG